MSNYSVIVSNTLYHSFICTVSNTLYHSFKHNVLQFQTHSTIISSDQFCTFDTSFYAAASYVKCKCNILQCIEPVLHLFAASYVNAEFCNPRDEQIVYIYIARCIYISQHVHIFQFWRMVTATIIAISNHLFHFRLSLSQLKKFMLFLGSQGMFLGSIPNVITIRPSS